jgi:hypothetical protein
VASAVPPPKEWAGPKKIIIMSEPVFPMCCLSRSAYGLNSWSEIRLSAQTQHFRASCIPQTNGGGPVLSIRNVWLADRDGYNAASRKPVVGAKDGACAMNADRHDRHPGFGRYHKCAHAERQQAGNAGECAFRMRVNVPSGKNMGSNRTSRRAPTASIPPGGTRTRSEKPQAGVVHRCQRFMHGALRLFAHAGAKGYKLYFPRHESHGGAAYIPGILRKSASCLSS